MDTVLIILRYTHHLTVGLRAHVMTCQAVQDGHNTSLAVLVVTPTNNVGSRKEMPTLTPSYLPPPAFSDLPSPPYASSNGTRFSATKFNSPKQDTAGQRSDMPPMSKRVLKVPFVKLDTPTIQEDMAASLAVALLGHVLFLKSQVPLCAASFIKKSHNLLNYFPTALILVPLPS